MILLFFFLSHAFPLHQRKNKARQGMFFPLQTGSPFPLSPFSKKIPFFSRQRFSSFLAAFMARPPPFPPKNKATLPFFFSRTTAALFPFPFAEFLSASFLPPFFAKRDPRQRNRLVYFFFSSSARRRADSFFFVP